MGRAVDLIYDKLTHRNSVVSRNATRSLNGLIPGQRILDIGCGD